MSRQEASTLPRNRAAARGSRFTVILLCFFAIIFDGYDLIVYGSTVPILVSDKGWSLAPGTAGFIGSLSLVGMLIGTLGVGVLTDILGRRKILLISVTWFSAFMLLTALSPSPEVFGTLRFLTGLGLGGIVPTCVALTVEFAPKSKRQIANALMYSGYSVGGLLAAFVAILALPHLDFRWLYAMGAVPLVTLLPIAYRYLPESIAFLAATGKAPEAMATAASYGVIYSDVVNEDAERAVTMEQSKFSGLRALFSSRWIFSTLFFAVASFCGLLLVYGLNTWLPQIMRSAGFNLGSSLTFLLVLNAGAIIGTIAASYVADRIGIKRVVTASFLVAVVSIMLLSLHLPLGVLLIFVAFAGLGSVGTQIFVNGFVATHYPQSITATALGWSLGIGRFGAIAGPLIGGFAASLLLGYQVNFYIFAGFAVVGTIVIALVPSKRRSMLRTN